MKEFQIECTVNVYFLFFEVYHLIPTTSRMCNFTIALKSGFIADKLGVNNFKRSVEELYIYTKNTMILLIYILKQAI